MHWLLLLGALALPGCVLTYEMKLTTTELSSRDRNPIDEPFLSATVGPRGDRLVLTVQEVQLIGVERSVRTDTVVDFESNSLLLGFGVTALTLLEGGGIKFLGVCSLLASPFDVPIALVSYLVTPIVAAIDYGDEPNGARTTVSDTRREERPLPGVKVKVWTLPGGLVATGTTDERGALELDSKVTGTLAPQALRIEVGGEAAVASLDAGELREHQIGLMRSAIERGDREALERMLTADLFWNPRDEEDLVREGRSRPDVADLFR